MVLGVANTPALFAGDAELPKSCRTIDRVEYCVHVGHASQLPELVSTVEPVVSAYGAANLPFDRIYDRALAGPFVRPNDDRTFYYDMGPTLPIDAGVSELAGVSAGGVGCQKLYSLNEQNEFTRNMRMLADRLEGTSDRTPGNPFTGLSASRLSAWVTAHRAQVRSCGIGDSELP
jgi:hypothetical protein